MNVRRLRRYSRVAGGRSVITSHLILLALMLLLAPTGLAQGAWLAAPELQQRLAAGEVVVQSATASAPSGPRGGVRAAVRIRAPAAMIWSVITDCRQTLLFVPGLRRCRSVGRAPDGRWEDIEHEVRFSWFFPTVRYVFRAEYEPPYRIDFHRISGDLKKEEGTWRLTPSADGSATVVEYEMYLDPGFWIPQALVSRSLRKDLPAALLKLRDCVERT